MKRDRCDKNSFGSPNCSVRLRLGNIINSLYNILAGIEGQVDFCIAS